MKSEELNYNECLMFLIKNSILTYAQVSLISKRLNNDRSCGNQTAGSYYRQLNQCKMKVRRIIYTIILLKILTVFDDNIDTSLEQVVERLSQVIKLSDAHDDNKYISHLDYQQTNVSSMLSMLDSIITRLVKI
jgi:hypothetical protein